MPMAETYAGRRFQKVLETLRTAGLFAGADDF